MRLRPPEVAVEACPEAETVAAVAVGADSAVAEEGTDAKNAIYGLTVLVQKLQQTHLKPRISLQKKPIIRKKPS